MTARMSCSSQSWWAREPAYHFREYFTVTEELFAEDACWLTEILDGLVTVIRAGNGVFFGPCFQCPDRGSARLKDTILCWKAWTVGSSSIPSLSRTSACLLELGEIRRWCVAKPAHVKFFMLVQDRYTNRGCLHDPVVVETLTSWEAHAKKPTPRRVRCAES
jgi:hypothetical protein